MSESTVAEADRRLEAALTARDARDPRTFYRERLRELKERDPEAYDEAVRYYREVLIHDVASGSRDPLHAWIEYGRTLAVALAPGRTVRIDATGRAHDYEGPNVEDLILQIPGSPKGRAVLIGLPTELSAAQRATWEVLVAGKTRRSTDAP